MIPHLSVFILLKAGEVTYIERAGIDVVRPFFARKGIQLHSRMIIYEGKVSERERGRETERERKREREREREGERGRERERKPCGHHVMYMAFTVLLADYTLMSIYKSAESWSGMSCTYKGRCLQICSLVG